MILTSMWAAKVSCFGYASEEAEDATLLTHSMATRGKNLTDVRKNGDLWWLRLDGETEVTIECFDSSPNLATKHIIYELCWPTVVFFFRFQHSRWRVLH